MLVAGTSAVLTVYWFSQMVRSLPESYRGEIRGGLFLNLSLLAGALSQLLSKSRLRAPLLIVSIAFVVLAMYFIFGQHPPDMHL